jgi:hypothetical protein
VTPTNAFSGGLILVGILLRGGCASRCGIECRKGSRRGWLTCRRLIMRC